MRVLITAGGTSEPIDQVRSITNHSTGRLGKEIAAVFQENEVWQIDYVVTKQAQLPVSSKNLRLHFIKSTEDLLEKLTRLFSQEEYDAVIHSMAVSDFTTESALSQEVFLTQLKKMGSIQDKKAAEDFWNSLAIISADSTKISSDTDRLILALKKTPKIIQEIKKLQPNTILVGFKLLVAASKDELLAAAKASLKKNQADFILANDLTEIDEENHHGYLLTKSGSVYEAQTKIAIAKMIFDQVQNQRKDAQ